MAAVELQEIDHMDIHPTNILQHVFEKATPLSMFREFQFSTSDKDRMEIDDNDFQLFLADKPYVSDLNEGYFAVLMNDLRKEIWSRLTDDKTFAICMRVNSRWRREIEEAWKESTKKRNFVNDYWEQRGLDWKWMLKCHVIKFAENETRNGPGSFEDKTSGPYIGDWKDNKQHGFGTKVFGDKSIYVGEWKENMKQGQGTYTWEDKTKYVGDWKEDKYHGFGVKTWSDGDKYEGYWIEDKKHGYGTYLWSNGDRYDGEWHEDKQHGFGVFVWSTGVKYVGKFKDNMRNDEHAVLTWPNGDRYEGGFKDNLIEGHGTYRHSSGDVYIGEWRASQRHGRANYIYQYGGRFEGYFIDDERNGEGLFEWPDGDKFQGLWKDGGRYGKGLFITKGGNVIDQIWYENPHANYAEKMPVKFPGGLGGH